MCDTARLALVVARRGRDDAKLSVLQGRQEASADVQYWEAQCANAETALAECLEKRQDDVGGYRAESPAVRPSRATLTQSTPSL